MTNTFFSLLTEILNFLTVSIKLVPELIKVWWFLGKKITLSLFSYWKTKLFYDKIFFIFLFLQLFFSVLPWFHYEIVFFESNESVSLSPKLNSIFILISLLNFFFLGFWKSTWTRLWFFATEMICVIIVLWGYLEPKRTYYDFVNPNEVSTQLPFYLFLISLFFSFVFGYLSFKKEDEVYVHSP
ncbi:hypothetical protein EHQ43_13490 [Leptospira bouyouniensis]|uniref:Uncharacterized protein n=1 Tax=Leptospira bouyouniensis TaxID=2484911 RepID=A0A7I0HR06_9LEPT|nr:hypothetical protein [Leptospira bouyouniensis]TGL04391.1 hypothetical protein EHQ43_13490 [Leptospira bouyouniensis]